MARPDFDGRLAAAGGARIAPIADATVEWRTVAALAVCYGLGVLGLALLGSALQTPGPLGWLACLACAPITAYAAALHASLQHEAVHGHPTRSAALNETLVGLNPILLFPYRRFKELHLKHHRDERLTDPYDDPESWYVADGDYARLSRPMRWLLARNQSLLGRMLIGPWLSAFALWRGDLADAAARPERRGRLVGAYARHALGAGATLAIAWAVFGVGPAAYVLFVAWPGAALLMLRTFAEHRAAEAPDERTAIVESGPVLSFLFLNNNLHAVHHAHPRAPWYELPRLYAQRREDVLRRNGGYRMDGYGAVVASWLLRPKEPVAHPILRRRAGADDDA